MTRSDYDGLRTMTQLAPIHIDAAFFDHAFACKLPTEECEVCREGYQDALRRWKTDPFPRDGKPRYMS
jgi:hypothetical protein